MLPKLARHKYGFTMVETMLSVTLFATIVGTTATILFRGNEQPAIDRGLTTAIHAVERARQSSLQSEQDSAWGVLFSDNNVTLFRGASYAERITDADTLLSLGDVHVNTPTEIDFIKGSHTLASATTIPLVGFGNTYLIYVSTDGLVTY